jgi:hypothetical protein
VRHPAALALNARLDCLSLDLLDRALAEEKSLVEVLSVRISPLLVPTPDAAIFTLGALPADEESLRGVLTNQVKAFEEAGISGAEALKLAVEAAQAELEGGMMARGALSAAVTEQTPAGVSKWCQACKSTHIHESLFRLIGVSGVFVLARMGKRTGYVRANQWLGSPLNADRASARRELLRRYLGCFGPSTAEQFAAWVGIGNAEARRDWSDLAGELVELDLDGRQVWLHADDLPRFERPTEATGVRLLPPYDAYLDQRDRATLISDREIQRRVWTVLGNPGVVLVDGEIVGLWRPQKKGKRLLLTVEAFGPLSPVAREEIEGEAARLAPLRGCTSGEVTFSA